MIPEATRKIKVWTTENRFEMWAAAVVFLVAVGSFGLGRLSILWPSQKQIQITGNQEAGIMNQGGSPTVDTASTLNSKLMLRNSVAGEGYVASKNGSAYHLPDCPGAKRINPENLIRFKTRQEAEKLGYRPAANCPGL